MTNQSPPLEYLKLFRLQTGATTALAPIIGYLIMTIQLNYPIILLELFIIFIIGILMHIFVFVLNEYIDVDVDRRSKDLGEKPLVKGTISTKAALGIVIISMILSYLVAILFFIDLWTLIFLTLAFEFGAIYDIYGKKFAGSDFTLALWIFFFCLFGASVISIEFSGLVYLIAMLGFFQILFNNAIEGGLKDADHDATAGAKTLAHSLGVRIKKKKAVIPNTFKLASYGIKLAHLAIIAIIIYIGTMSFYGMVDYLQFLLLTILILIMICTLNEFLSQKEFDRNKLKRIFSIHEIATFYMVPILLLQFIGYVAVVSLLLLPLLWYICLNLILYGRPLEPRV
jgi:4-hydroxybenzoate polyprenyltransferase